MWLTGIMQRGPNRIFFPHFQIPRFNFFDVLFAVNTARIQQFKRCDRRWITVTRAYPNRVNTFRYECNSSTPDSIWRPMNYVLPHPPILFHVRTNTRPCRGTLNKETLLWTECQPDPSMLDWSETHLRYDFEELSASSFFTCSGCIDTGMNSANAIR